MTSERFKKIREHFGVALELESEERKAYLLRLYIDHPDIASDIDKLLSALSDNESFIEQPAIAAFPSLIEEQLPILPVGSRLGAYCVGEKIAVGGVATVYNGSRADGLLRRRVAIKVLHPTLVSKEAALAFARELQALADTHHTSCCTLFDAGETPEGLRYAVLEYLDGIRIDDYCNQHRLDVSGRLAVFLQVCHAVQSLHVTGILHGDLKPANILVRDEAFVRLIDLAAARRFSGETTRHMLRSGESPGLTLEYASPELIRAQKPNPSSEVYSLCVILYELLTGVSPYRLTSRLPEHVIEAALFDAPALPSRALVDNLANAVESPETREGARKKPGFTGRLEWHMKLGGDLDAIVLMGLQKDASERYFSVADLARDVRAYLDGDGDLRARQREARRLRVARRSTLLNCPLKVFLAHSSADKPAVRKLYRDLQAIGAIPWLDEEDVLPGESWRDAIDTGLKGSDIIVICLSERYIDTVGYLQRELQHALERAREQPVGSIYLIPVRLEDCDIPEPLRAWHWVNLYEERGFERLQRALDARCRQLKTKEARRLAQG